MQTCLKESKEKKRKTSKDIEIYEHKDMNSEQEGETAGWLAGTPPPNSPSALVRTVSYTQTAALEADFSYFTIKLGNPQGASKVLKLVVLLPTSVPTY
jgi:hypothetical protein